MQALTSKLRQLREAAGVSRGALADAAGLNRGYYGRLEAGKVTAPSWFSICAIAKVLGVSLDSLQEKESSNI